MGGHGHDNAHGAAAVAGPPTPLIGDPSVSSTARCKRRWNDVALLRLDAMSPATYAGANPRFRDESQVYKQLRERYLLFVNCVESAPGKEPKHEYLYPQTAVPTKH